MILNQKGIAHLFLIFILLVGIIAGVFLVGKQQIFKPKATGVNIEFLENSCTKDKEGTKVLICPKPKIKFTSPLEVGNAKLESFNLIKTAYAAGSGKGYYCLSDSEKIYHKEKVCNPVLGILCFTWLSSHEEEKAENCDIGYECSDSTTDILNNVTSAKCVVTPKRQSAGSFQPRFVSDSAPEVQPSENPQVEPPVRQANRTFTPAPTQASRTQTFQTQTSTTQTSNTGSSTGSSSNGGSGSTNTGNDNAGSNSNTGSDNTGTGTTAPNAGTGATAPNTGTGATNPSPAAARTTIKFRFAEDRDKLDSADWRRYTPGGTTIVEDFTFSPTPGRKAIFAEFMDGSNQIIKFDSGQEYSVAYIVLVPETSSSPSPSAVASSNPEQVACNGVVTRSGGKAGESTTIQVNYKGTPAKLQVWMASNSDLGKGVSAVSNWTNVKGFSTPSNSISFNIPSDMLPGDHAIMVSLHDSSSMLDGNPGGVVNPKCSASLPVLPVTLPPVSTPTSTPAPIVSTPTPTPTPKPVDISCIGKVCTCGDTTIGDTRNPGQCSDCGSGGWCNGGTCASCSP